jgi:hypothetical protein
MLELLDSAEVVIRVTAEAWGLLAAGAALRQSTRVPWPKRLAPPDAPADSPEPRSAAGQPAVDRA